MDEDTVALPRASQPLSVIDALVLVRKGRPFAEPNEGFMSQLYLYVDMGCPTTDAQLQSHRLYKRWLNRRSVKMALEVGMAPEMDYIVFEDEIAEEKQEADEADEADSAQNAAQQAEENTQTETVTIDHGLKNLRLANERLRGTTAALTSSMDDLSSNKTAHRPAEKEIKCRKCRTTLAQSTFLVPHKPPPHRDLSSHSQAQATTECAHIFLQPLSWMRPHLSNGELDGRLTCPNPKCGANIGKFAWQGLRCSCGGWVTPGFGVARGRVDEVVARGARGRAGGRI